MTETPRWLATKFDVRAVARRAEQLADGLEVRHPGFVAALRNDPLDALSSFDEIQFDLTHHERTGPCSILGRYNPSTTPPTISVTQRGQGQTWFSALHELGHHEQNGDFAWLAAMQQVDQSARRTLEEQTCEAFAAEILLGADVVAEHVGDAIGTAQTIETLHHATGASRAACAVRVLQLLRADGLVMVADLDAKVLFSTGSGDVNAPKRGTVQASDSVVARAAAGRVATSRDAAVMYGTGRQRWGFAADAVRDGEYVYAVFTSGRPGWVKGAYAARSLHWDGAEHHCRCGEVFTPGTGNYCEHCHRGDCCPDCGVCVCAPEPVRDRTCTGCFMSLSLAQFDGDSGVCRECAL